MEEVISPNLSVIIPVYNEEDCIEQVILSWSEMLKNCVGPSFQIVCVNDGSKDNSLYKLKSLENSVKELVELDQKNKGHVHAILNGYQQSLNSDWIFQVDSDDEMKPKHFPQLWKNRDQFDFLVGIRIERQSPLSRSLITLVSRWTIWLLYGFGVKDVNCPYRLMRNSFVSKGLKLIPSNTFAPNLLLSGLSSIWKQRIFQTEVPYEFRTTGAVSINHFNAFKIAFRSFKETILFRAKLNKN